MTTFIFTERCVSKDPTIVPTYARAILCYGCPVVRVNTPGVDYCNSLTYGIADGPMQRLQAVQKDAARLITGARLRDHISPVLRQLHWLPVRQRVQFKLAVLLFKARQCLTDDCQLVAAAGRRQLRSSDAVACLVQRTRTSLGDHAFGVDGPRLWNALRSASVSLSSPYCLVAEFRADAATMTGTQSHVSQTAYNNVDEFKSR